MDEFMESTKKAGHTRELKRLSDNHETFTDAMGGLLLAPVDLSRPDLRVLDVAGADGTLVLPFLFTVSKKPGEINSAPCGWLVPRDFPFQLMRD